MDGTSGALYAIFLNSLISSLRQQSSSTHSTSIQVWATALNSATHSLSHYTPARPGDRTLVDALHPFNSVLTNASDLREAAEAARKGAEGTKGMKASLGRTVYVGGDGWEQVPDPGAWGLSEFFLGLAGVKGEEKVIEPVAEKKEEKAEESTTKKEEAEVVVGKPLEEDYEEVSGKATEENVAQKPAEDGYEVV